MVDHVCSSLPACGISHILHSNNAVLSMLMRWKAKYAKYIGKWTLVRKMLATLLMCDFVNFCHCPALSALWFLTVPDDVCKITYLAVHQRCHCMFVWRREGAVASFHQACVFQCWTCNTAMPSWEHSVAIQWKWYDTCVAMSCSDSNCWWSSLSLEVYALHLCYIVCNLAIQAKQRHQIWPTHACIMSEQCSPSLHLPLLLFLLRCQILLSQDQAWDQAWSQTSPTCHCVRLLHTSSLCVWLNLLLLGTHVAWECWPLLHASKI